MYRYSSLYNVFFMMFQSYNYHSLVTLVLYTYTILFLTLITVHLGYFCMHPTFVLLPSFPRQVIAQGLLYGKGAYFSSGWNIMDGSLVIISFVDIIMSFLATTSPRIFGILRVFRLLRALRPLR